MPYWSIAEWRACIGSSWCALGRPHKIKTSIRYGARIVKKELTLNRVVAMLILLILLIGVNIGLRTSVEEGYHHQLMSLCAEFIQTFFEKAVSLKMNSIILTMIILVTFIHSSAKRSQRQSVSCGGICDFSYSAGLLLYAMFLILKMVYPAMNLVYWLIPAAMMIHALDVQRALSVVPMLSGSTVKMKILRNGLCLPKCVLDVAVSIAASVIVSLLLLSGDIEQNPGPLGDLDYNSVDANKTLSEDDLINVLEAVLPIKSVYFSLGQCLGLPLTVLESIRKAESDAEQALSDTLKLWLQQKYDTERFGPPTWRMLVEAVDKEAGGNSNELAKEIASNHRTTSVQLLQDHFHNVYKTALQDTGHNIVNLQMFRMVLCGAPRSGKTTFWKRIAMKDFKPSPESASTGAAESHIISAVGREKQESDRAHVHAEILFDMHLYSNDCDLDSEALTIYKLILERHRPKPQPETHIAKSQDKRYQPLTESHKPEDELQASNRTSGTQKNLKADKILKLATDKEDTPSGEIRKDLSAQDDLTSAALSTLRLSNTASKKQPPDPIIAEINKQFEQLNQLLTSKDLSDLPNIKRMCHLQDTASQRPFLELLPTLSTGKALYLLFFSYENFEKSVSETRQAEGSPEELLTGIEYEQIDVIMQSLICVSTTSEVIQSTIEGQPTESNNIALLVGTHVDRVTSETVTRVDKIIYERVKPFLIKRRLVHAQSGGKECLVLKVAINETKLCSNRPEDYVNVIMSIVDNKLKSKESEELPASWYMFCLMLRRLQSADYPVLRYSHCQHIAKELYIPQSELKSVLFRLKNVFGIVLYFPEVKALEDIVVCDPAFVYKRISELIFGSFRGPFELPLRKKLQKHGIFKYRELEKEHEIKQDLELSKLIILLKHLGIIYPINRSDTAQLAESEYEDDSDNKDIHPDQEYVIPCVLKEAKQHQLNVQLKNTQACSIVPLRIYFDCGFAPMGGFCHLFTKLISNNKGWELRTPDVWEDENHIYWRNKVTLKVKHGSHNYFVTLLSTDEYYEIHIIHSMPQSEWPFQLQNDGHSICKHVWEAIHTILEKSPNKPLRAYRVACICTIAADEHVMEFERKPHEPDVTVYCEKCDYYPRDTQPSVTVWHKPPRIQREGKIGGKMHLCDLLFKINDGQKPPECALWLNGKPISEADIVLWLDGKKISDSEADKHYRVDYITERKMFKVSIPHFESELKGVYECVASTVEEPTVSTSVEVVINCDFQDDLLTESDIRILAIVLAEHLTNLEESGLNLNQGERITKEEVVKHLQNIGQEQLAEIFSQNNGVQRLQDHFHKNVYETALQDTEHIVNLQVFRMVLCGVPRSGKTTFWKRIAKEGFTPSPISASTGAAESHIMSAVERKNKKSGQKSQAAKEILDLMLFDFHLYSSTSDSDLDSEALTIYKLIMEKHRPKPQPEIHSAKSQDEQYELQTETYKTQDELQASINEIQVSKTKENLKSNNSLKPVTDSGITLLPSPSGDIPKDLSEMNSANSPALEHKTASKKETSDAIIAEIDEQFEKLNQLHMSKDLPDLPDIKKMCHLQDTGGQRAFLELLPTLSTGKALYLLFFNYKDFEKSVSETRQAEGSPKELLTGIEYKQIDIIMQSLICVSTASEVIQSTDESQPTKSNNIALLVGTHVDDQVTSEDIIRIDNEIHERVKPFLEKGRLMYAHSGGKECLVLKVAINENKICSNKPEDYVNVIMDIVDNKLKCKESEELPASWYMFCIMLRRLQSDYPVLRYSHCQQIATELYIKPSALKSVLFRLQNVFGILLYFPEVKALKDIVICDPTFVYKSISELIFGSFRGRCEVSLLNKLQKYGIFEYEELKKQCKIKQDLELSKLIILLKHLGIIASIKRSNNAQIAESEYEDDSDNEDIHPDQEYVIPCVLKEAKQHQLNVQLKNTQGCSIVPLRIYFACGFAPMGGFCYLFTKLISNNKGWELCTPDVWEDENHIYWRNKVTLKVKHGSHNYFVILLSTDEYYEIHIIHSISELPFQLQNDGRSICKHVWKAIHTVLEKSPNKPLQAYKVACICTIATDEHVMEFKRKPHEPDVQAYCEKCGCSPPLHTQPSVMVWFKPPHIVLEKGKIGGKMHLCDLLFKINDGQKRPECVLWLNGKKISDSETDKHYTVGYKTERKIFKVSIPNFESELKGVYECVASTVEEPTVSTSVEVVINYGRESCAAGVSAPADCADIVKYQTMIKCTVALKDAVSHNLVNLSGYLLKNGLISEDNEREIRNEYTPEAGRAAKLVDVIRGKVKESHKNYDKFVETLKEAGSEQYKDILKTLDETLHETLCEESSKRSELIATKDAEASSRNSLSLKSSTMHKSNLSTQLQEEHCSGTPQKRKTLASLGQPSPTDSSDSSALPHNIIDSSPTIAQLSLLKTAAGGKIRIISRLAPHWRDLGYIMNFDSTGAEIKSIEQQYPGVPKECCRAMFQHWLSGNGVRPCSWGTLIELLKDCDQQALIEEIQSALSAL